MNAREVSASQSAWFAACEVHSRLASGGRLGGVPVKYPGLVPEAGEEAVGIFDSREGNVMGYARFTGAQVSYFVPGVMAMGSPAFVAGAMLGNAATRRRARKWAERESAPQWWPEPMASVVVTTCRLWCELATSSGSQWLNFDYPTITSLELTNWDLTLKFLRSAPLRLSGMWAPWCAAVIAHYRYGLDVIVPALGRQRPMIYA